MRNRRDSIHDAEIVRWAFLPVESQSGRNAQRTFPALTEHTVYCPCSASLRREPARCITSPDMSVRFGCSWKLNWR